MLAVGLLATVAGLAAAGWLGAREDRILHTGVATTAEVVGGAGYDEPGFRHGDVVFRYVVEGRTYRVSLGRNDDSPAVNLGDAYTLYVDRQDPRQVASTSFDEVPAWQAMVWVAALGGGVALFLVGLLSAARRVVWSWQGGESVDG